MEKMEKRKKVVANKMFSILKMIDDYINNNTILRNKILIRF